MLDKIDPLSHFKYKLESIIEDFRKLLLPDQCKAMQFFENCLEDMQKALELSKLSKKNNIEQNGFEQYIVKNDVMMHTRKKSIDTKTETITKPPLSNHLNIFTNNYFNIQEPMQEAYSDSEKDEPNGSTRSFQKQLNSLVERLENDETFLNSDNGLETNYENIINNKYIKKEHKEENCSSHQIEKNNKTYKQLNSDNTKQNMCILIKRECFKDDSSNEIKENSDASNSESEDKLDISEKKIIGRSNAYVCVLCRKQLKSYTSLIEHVFKHPGAAQSCIKCKNTFNNAISYKCHLIDNFCNPSLKFGMEKYKRYPIKNIMCCPHCGKRFVKSFNLRRHVLNNCDTNDTKYSTNSSISEKNFRCILCQQSFDTEETYQKHKMQNHEKYQCKKCDKSFTSRKLLREHGTIHRKSSQKSLNKYICEVCDITFPIRALYRDHMKTYKTDQKHIQMKKTSTTNRAWCKICSKNFVDEKTYQRHCKCESHMRANEQHLTLTKDFVCEKCGLALKSKYALSDHLRRMHKNRALLKCEQCPYSTTVLNNLIRHENINHQKAPKKFACDKCPTLFISLSALKDHMTCSHSEERPFSCDICDKKFKLSSQLRRHKIIHNPIMPHGCSFCDSKFRRYTHLQRHILSKHGENVAKNELTVKMNKNQKYANLKQPMSEEIQNLQDDQMFTFTYLLSTPEIGKNNVINMSSEGDLLNGVNIPDLWNGSVMELYSSDAMLQDVADGQSSYILQENSAPVNSQVALIEVPKNTISEYVSTNYIEFPERKNINNMEILTGNYNIIKSELLTQEPHNSEMIVADHNSDNLSISHSYNTKP